MFREMRRSAQRRRDRGRLEESNFRRFVPPGRWWLSLWRADELRGGRNKALFPLGGGGEKSMRSKTIRKPRSRSSSKTRSSKSVSPPAIFRSFSLGKLGSFSMKTRRDGSSLFSRRNMESTIGKPRKRKWKSRWIMWPSFRFRSRIRAARNPNIFWMSNNF